VKWRLVHSAIDLMAIAAFVASVLLISAVITGAL